MRFGVYALLLVSAAALLFFALKPRGQTLPPSESNSAAGSFRSPSSRNPTAGGTDAANQAEKKEVQLFDLTSELNAAHKSVSDDLRVLESVFLAWQSNFLKQGNPVGTNAEITRALLGDNELGIAYVSITNPALNRERELCDRWGTPYFFHQLSGSRMQIVSAGPDKKRGTADDAGIE